MNGSRRRRIAAGSGTSVQDVNRLLKQYQDMAGMMKKMKKLGQKGLMRHGLSALCRRDCGISHVQLTAYPQPRVDFPPNCRKSGSRLRRDCDLFS